MDELRWALAARLVPRYVRSLRSLAQGSGSSRSLTYLSLSPFEANGERVLKTASTAQRLDSSSAARPTYVRFLTLSLCIAMAMLLYLDRYALSPVTGTLLAELHVNKEQLGRTVFFAFFFAYAVCQVP